MTLLDKFRMSRTATIGKSPAFDVILLFQMQGADLAYRESLMRVWRYYDQLDRESVSDIEQHWRRLADDSRDGSFGL